MNSIVTDKMWKLLEAALEDLKKVEKDERYVVDMMSWHGIPDWDHSHSHRCHVCLAGARLVGAGALPSQSLGPSDLPSEEARMLETLNSIRTGHLDIAYRIFAGKGTPCLRNFPRVEYVHTNWWEHMNGILMYLKELDV